MERKTKKIGVIIGAIILVIIFGLWSLNFFHADTPKISCEKVIKPNIIDKSDNNITVGQIFESEIPQFFIRQPFDTNESEIKMNLTDTIIYYHGEEWNTFYKLLEITEDYVMFECKDIHAVPGEDDRIISFNLKIYSDGSFKCENIS